jgi:hypothetical protein
VIAARHFRPTFLARLLGILQCGFVSTIGLVNVALGFTPRFLQEGQRPLINPPEGAPGSFMANLPQWLHVPVS